LPVMVLCTKRGFALSRIITPAPGLSDTFSLRTR
jgi:hypothetical protein